jgi:hypothetical protein
MITTVELYHKDSLSLFKTYGIIQADNGTYRRCRQKS